MIFFRKKVFVGFHRIETRLLAMAALLAVATTAGAAWRVVFDPVTTAQVAANTASQKVIEEQHNARLDSMSAKQQKIMQYTAAMQTIRELYKLSMENIRGFGEESKYYVEICQTALEIMANVPTVTKYINSSPVKNYVLCVSEIADVVTETEGLVADFVDIVNNGKVRNPLKKTELIGACKMCGGKMKMLRTVDKDAPRMFICQSCGWKTDDSSSMSENSGDGYNLLNRYERLTLANKIYSRLVEIKYRMEVMSLMCQFCSGISDVIYAIDPQSWAAWFTGKNIVEGLINDWNSLGV